MKRMIRASTVLAAALASACMTGSDRLPAFVQRMPEDSAFAVLGRGGLVVGFPRVRAADGWPSDSVGHGINAYEWRFGTEGPDALIASFGVRVKRNREAAPYGSLQAVLERATLQMCDPSPGHVLYCAVGPWKATAVEDRGRVVLRTGDTAIVNRFRRNRPEAVWISVFVPGGSKTLEAVAVTYR